MKAKDMLRAIEQYTQAKYWNTEDMLRELPEDKFRLALQASAELFRTLKKEAVRRGIWDDIVKKERVK